MGVKRMVDVNFWTDRKTDDFSPEDKYFMLYILTNPFTTQLGIYEISIRQAAFQMGYSEEAFRTLLDRFENKYGILKYSKDTGEIAIKNFLRHSVIKGGKPVEDCIIREMKKVKDRSLIDYVFDYIFEKEDINKTVKDIIYKYKNNNKNNNDNDNDSTHYCTLERTQECTHDESSLHKEKPKKEKPVKHKHGEYNNVLLTDEELDKLKTKFTDWQDRIERLSEYMASTGKSYKSHYVTILSWSRRDKERNVAKSYVQNSRSYCTASEEEDPLKDFNFD